MWTSLFKSNTNTTNVKVQWNLGWILFLHSKFLQITNERIMASWAGGFALFLYHSISSRKLSSNNKQKSFEQMVLGQYIILPNSYFDMPTSMCFEVNLIVYMTWSLVRTVMFEAWYGICTVLARCHFIEAKHSNKEKKERSCAGVFLSVCQLCCVCVCVWPCVCATLTSRGNHLTRDVLVHASSPLLATDPAVTELTCNNSPTALRGNVDSC